MTDLARLLYSLTSSDRHFAEDLDTEAAARLSGDDRDTALVVLIEQLDRGLDPRVPRCLAAMGAVEAATELRIAASTAQPATRAEAAIASAKLGGDAAFAVHALSGVLTGADTTPQGKVRAVIGLEGIGGQLALEALVAGLGDADPVVAGNAFDGIKRLLGVFGLDGAHSRMGAVETLLTLGLPEVRAAALAGLRLMIAEVRAGAIANWTASARVDDPEVAAIRRWMRPDGPAGPFPAAALVALTEADRARLQAWAVMHVRSGNPRGVAALLALGTPGAAAGLRALRARGGPLDDAIDAANP